MILGKRWVDALCVDNSASGQYGSYDSQGRRLLSIKCVKELVRKLARSSEGARKKLERNEKETGKETREELKSGKDKRGSLLSAFDAFKSWGW